MSSKIFTPKFDTGPYTYAGDNLREIAFPLGGIGTGCISLDGRGAFRDWEIYGRPNKNTLMEMTFPALFVREIGSAPRALALQGPRTRDWIGETAEFWDFGHGRMFRQMDGLPCFDQVEFVGTFPLARLRFTKANLPLEVELAAFNPFVPLDIDSSSFPIACLVYRFTNTGDKPLDVSVAWTMMNPVGGTSSESTTAENRKVESKTFTGIEFSDPGFADDDPGTGTVVLATNSPHAFCEPRWEPGDWWDAIQRMWNTFRSTGTLETTQPEASTRRAAGSLGAQAHLLPGESVEIPFTIAWRFPISSKYWDKNSPSFGHRWKPWYADRWPSAIAATEEFYSRYDELASRTLAFEEALFDSTLPTSVIESVSATASILHSPTVLRLDDGTFWAWEGCSPKEGCCSGTCSHVWNYALTHAYLFPDMQFSMRRAEYTHSFNCGPEGPKGALNFRVMLPLGHDSTLWHAASDGQLGGIVQLYRDWRLSGDEARLRELWPAAKRALGYAWVMWDRDRDGLVEGSMHNTYDINFEGPNPLTQFFYLAALRSAAEIAEHLGEVEDAAEYRRLYDSGRPLTEERLWNGEFFVQTMDCLVPGAPKYQHGLGCLTDQVFGQLAATVAGLGDLVDPTLIRTALRSIYNHNFLSPLGDHENLQRVYAMQDESGLLLASWPNGGRPEFPFPYSDEVWTGIEYQVATHLAYEGMRAEALAIVEGIRARYDGRRRNPYNEFECGSHYARALASYGLILAFSGVRADAVTKTLTAIGPDCRSLFVTPSGWGSVEVKNGEPKVTLSEGTVF